MSRKSQPLALLPALLLAALFFLFAVLPCLAAAADGCPDLVPSQVKERVESLREEIRYHNDLYYKKLRPAISDAQYDRLFAELLRLERCYPALAAVASPTGTVGDDSGSGAMSLRHERPMLSLSSSTGPEAVQALLQRTSAGGIAPRLLVQPKVDGLPVELIYQSGRLLSAATRGNGQYGEDVTARVRKISGIPQTLSGSYPERVAVRGEIYADLARLAAGDGDAAGSYATPRHFAAGTLRSQDPAPSALAALRLFPFELVHAREDFGLVSDLAALARLAELGFPVRSELTWQAETLDQIRALYEDFRTKRSRQAFAADGIVVKLDDLVQRGRLGAGARAPFWAAAWKFPPTTAASVVRAIRWQVGRTGRRTPVAELDPVRLGGVRVSHVSLQNAETLARLGIAVGDRVVIALVGDVIPQVQEVIRQVRPAAGTGPAAVRPAQLPLDACLKDAPGCRDQFLARAVHFASRAGLNIRGLGRGRLQSMIRAGLVPDLPSLFRLKPQELAAVAGFGPESARRLTAAIKRAGRPQPFQLVRALGIPGVGPAAANRLAGEFGSLDALLDGGEGDRGGGSAGASIRRFFATEGGEELLAGFRDLGLL